MGKMNVGRVILGGLVAGLVMNASEAFLHAGVLGADGTKLLEDWKQRGVDLDVRPSLVFWLIGITFVLGILAIWTYAAIRPRFGAGPKTALLCRTRGLGNVLSLRSGLHRRGDRGVAAEADLASRGLGPRRDSRRDSSRGVGLSGMTSC